MAEKKPKIVARRRAESVRERAEKSARKKSAEPRHRKMTEAASKPVKGIRRTLAREYHPIRLPDNRAGNFLTARRSTIPSLLTGSWQELKLVTWPTRRQVLNMTIAVIIFSVGIAVVVKLLDLGFEKLFKEVILR